MKSKVFAIIIVMALLSCAVIIPADSSEAAEAKTATGSIIGPGDPVFDQVNDILIGAGQFFEGIADGFYDWATMRSGPEAGPSASDPDNVKSYAKEVVSRYAAEDLSVLAVTSAALMDNDSETWKLAQSYLDRAAEVSAASLWAPNTAYDAEAALVFGGIYRIIASSMDNTNEALAYAVDNMADRRSHWTEEPYSEIPVSIVWSGGSTSAATTSAKLIFSSIVSASQDHGRVRLSSSGSTVIWALDGEGVMIGDDGQTINLSPGRNVVSAHDGWFTLSGGHYAGSFLPSVADNASGADCTGGVVISVDGSYGYAVHDGTDLRISYGGAQYDSSFLKYRYGSEETQTLGDEDAIAHLIRSYSGLHDAYSTALAMAARAGQVMWTISAAAGESNVLLSPSAITPQLTTVGIDANQAYALYVGALMQISSFYDIHGEQLAAGQTLVSAESLQLYCRGDLHNADGTVIMADVVFTPYVYAKNMSLYTESASVFSQDGIAMVWTAPGAVSSLSGFSSSAVTDHKLVIMPKGSYITASEIVYDGTPVPTATLQVKEISSIELLSSIAHIDVSVPKVLPASTMVQVVLIMAAIIVAIIALFVVRSPILLILSAALIVVAVVCPEWVARILTEMMGS